MRDDPNNGCEGDYLKQSRISISSSTKNELKMSSGQLLPRVAVQVKINRVQVQRFNVISSRKINRLQLARAFILELYYSAVVELSSGIISHEKPQPRTIRTKSSAYAFSVLILTVSATFMPPPRVSRKLRPRKLRPKT